MAGFTKITDHLEYARNDSIFPLRWCHGFPDANDVEKLAGLASGDVKALLRHAENVQSESHWYQMTAASSTLTVCLPLLVSSAWAFAPLVGGHGQRYFWLLLLSQGIVLFVFLMNAILSNVRSKVTRAASRWAQACERALEVQDERSEKSKESAGWRFWSR